MPKVVGYHRPVTVEEAVSLLAQPSAAVLAGGTRVNATPFGNPIVAVDVQALGLTGISQPSADTFTIGAATPVQARFDDVRLPEVLRELARREAPSTLRTLATVGGTIAAGGLESELLTGLLVCEASVTLRRVSGSSTVSLTDLLADCTHLTGALITDVTIRTDGRLAADHTGRTPGDQAIVSAVARRTSGGAVLVAASGVSVTPVLVDDIAALEPNGDFRGSAEYRKHLATVLVSRVTKAVSA